MQRQPSTFVDAELLAGTTVNFPRSLVRLAWILQHAATLLPMAGDIQAVLNSQTAGVSDIHAWGLMLPSSSRVSPVTYHSVVAVRYPDLCRFLTLLVFPLDMMGLMGMAQVVTTTAYGIRGLRRGETTWGWPDFDANPEQENLAQISRWSLNSAPAWEFPPLAIANQRGEASEIHSRNDSDSDCKAKPSTYRPNDEASRKW